MIPSFYVNVFCDDAGGIHYSTEEFAAGRQGLLNFDEAAEDACRFSVLGGWRYVCTLTPDERVTLKMHRRLNYLDQMRFMLESKGKAASMEAITSTLNS